MKISRKFALEMIVLSSALFAISFVIVYNTVLIEKNFVDLNDQLIPALLNLKDMRLVASNMLTHTMEFGLVNNEFVGSETESIPLVEKAEIDEKINQGKEQFSQLLVLYRQHEFTAEDQESINNIEKRWKEFGIVAKKIVEYRKLGISDAEFLKLKDEMNLAKEALFREIDQLIITNENQVQQKKDEATKIVQQTTIFIIVVIPLAIGTIWFTRYYILRALLRRILRIRQTASEIAAGNFKTRISDISKDEVGELSESINEMAQDLEATQEKLLKTEKLSTIGTLAARMAHDIRNPLTVIIGGIEYMRAKYHFDEKNVPTLNTINRAIERISHQIEEVLDFVKTTPLSLDYVWLTPLFKQIISNLKIPDTIKVELPEVDTAIDCDHKKMEAALTNLIRNAVDAVGESGKIQIRVFDSEDRVRIEIEDSGPGIPDDIKSKIFEPLFTTKQRGTGLGLTSVKNIIEEHGGSIAFYNNPTIFSIILPRQKESKG